jgi:hypothetical protein
MRLSAQQLTDFRRIYSEVFGREISEQDALEQGLALITMVRTIAKNENELKNGNNTQLCE